MSIIEEVVDWCESDTILIKSALMPSTVDRLVEKTGKNIAVSVEYIGMGKYYVPPEKYPDPTDPSKHKVLVVGGEEPARTKAAELLWSKMSPDTRIHLVTAKEAEIVKLIENAYGALKVTFANCVYSLAENSGTNFINIHQAWSEDGRVDPMHTRVVSGKRGWKSHCYDKDIQALAYYAEQVGADDLEELFDVVVELNQEHLRRNG
jgi:UDP-glucose 6-dehydrogenase